MLDINQYTYEKDPFDLNEKFNIHPLNDEGVKTYYTKEAHTHTFLDKINPREMRKIYKEKEILDEYMQSVLEERNSKKNFTQRNLNKPTEENLKNEEENANNEEIFDSQNLRQIKANNINYPKNTYENKLRSKTSDNFYNLIKNNNNFKSNNFGNTRFYSPKKLDEKLAAFGNTNFGKKCHKTVIQPKVSKKRENKNSRYSFDEENAYPNTNSFYIRPYEKVGFESYNIPRISQNPQSKLKPIQVNQFEDKCFKSLSGFFSKSKSDSDFNGYLAKENERLANILMNQTNERFLKSNRLPKIAYIVNQPEIVVKKTGIGNSKFMGAGYNPHNFTMNMYKNKTKTNINGALYLH